MPNGRDLALIALRNSTKQDLSGWCQYFVGLMISAYLGRPAPGGYGSAQEACDASNLEFETPEEVPIGGILYFEYSTPGHDAVKIGDDLMVNATANKSGMVENLGRGVKITRISQYNRKFLGGSRANGNRPAIVGIQPYNPNPAPTPGKDVDAVAREVIAGKWGNGSERQQRLTAAGYDYAAVQARVNAILSGATPAPSKTLDQIAREVIAGNWGNGADRQRRLSAAGYDYGAVQARVNAILAESAPTPARKYTVRPGDSLSKIAQQFGVPGGWQQLYAANKAVIGGNPNVIKPGQVLVLP